MSLGAGQLSERLDVEVYGDAVNAANQPIKTWTAHPTVPYLWAQPKTSSGLSTVRSAEAGVPVGPTRYSFRARFIRELTTQMRFVDRDGFVYDIVGIKHDLEKREYTDFICETGASNG